VKPFAGFPDGHLSYTPIPDLFFSDLLADINDLAELKLTIYMFWALYHQKGSPRYLSMTELESEGSLLSGIPAQVDETRLETLHHAVENAVARGTLLRLDVESDEGVISYLLLNTSQGRDTIREVKRGTLVLETEGRVIEPHIVQERPSIFALYEDNIGLLTPLISEQLLEASRTFPDNWIRDAFKIAVERNVRNWRYIEGILKRWEAAGRKQR